MPVFHTAAWFGIQEKENTMNHLQSAFAATVPGILSNLERRNMEGFFFESSSDMIRDLLPRIPAGSIVTWGGSETLTDTGLLDAVRKGPYEILDRAVPQTPEEKRLFYSQSVLSDVYLMSTNALTYEGELINIDGNGNRLACLMQGPREVYVIAGMNKLVGSVEEGIHRIQNIAAPANVQRLGKQTPCATLGRCANCFSPESICSQVVITRRSGIKGRIKVVLIAENLGY